MPAKKDPAAMFAALAGNVLSDEPSEEPAPKVDPLPDVQPPEDLPSQVDEPVTRNESPLEPSPTSGLRVNVIRARTPAKKGRPPGKRSDPNYTQIGAYIPKDLDKAVKRLLVDEDEMDLSELVATLLEDWVKRKTS